jgi:hypothetical protein
MKITKEQLKRVIKESVSDRFALGKNSNMAAMMQAREAEEMKLKNQAEMDGRTDGFAGTEDKYDFWENEGEVYLRHYMIGLTDAEDEKEYYDDDLEENKMSITKEQLRSLIREQMSNVSEVADEYTPMMPPKPVDPEGIAGTDVPVASLSDGFDAAREAVEAMYSPTDRRYISAMMVIDMAEKQGAPKENDKDPKDPDIKHREAAPDSWRDQRDAELPPKWRQDAPGVTTTSLKDLKKMMKGSITKEHLQRIIKEEFEGVLSEHGSERAWRRYEKRYGKNRTRDALGNRIVREPETDVDTGGHADYVRGRTDGEAGADKPEVETEEYYAGYKEGEQTRTDLEQLQGLEETSVNEQ